MSDSTSNPGTARHDALKARNKRAKGRMKHAKGLLSISALGLMVACSTAYASTRNIPVSDTVNDSIVDWGLAIFIIIIAMFIAMIVVDARKNGRQG